AASALPNARINTLWTNSCDGKRHCHAVGFTRQCTTPFVTGVGGNGIQLPTLCQETSPRPASSAGRQSATLVRNNHCRSGSAMIGTGLLTCRRRLAARLPRFAPTSSASTTVPVDTSRLYGCSAHIAATLFGLALDWSLQYCRTGAGRAHC